VASDQREEYRGLVALDLASFTLTLTGLEWAARLRFPIDQEAVRHRYGAVRALHVTVRYQVRGMDSQPVAAPWVPLIGLTDGRWVVASESDDPHLPLGAGGQPWEAGPLIVTKRGHLAVVTSAAHPEVAAHLVPIAERAVALVSRFRPAGWDRQVLMLALDDRKVFDSYFRKLPGEYAAAAMPLEATVPEWDPSGAYVTSRILFNPKYLTLSDDKLLAILTHELTHAALGNVTADQTPIWLLEGTANYVSYPVERLTREQVRQRIRKAGIPDQLPDATFYTKGGNYDIAWLACRMIAQRYGPDRLLDLYVSVWVHRDLGAGAIDAAVADTLGLTVPQLTEAWRAYLNGLVD